MSLEQFLAQYGLFALGLLATVEGDVSLIVGGVLAHRGLFPLASVVAAGAAGNFIGDCAWYLLGRSARTHLQQTELYRRAGPWIEALALRLGPWQLLLARVVYGTRNMSMVFWGQYHLPFLKFALIDALGCALASIGFVSLGFLAGQGVTSLVGEIKRAEVGLLIAVVVGGIAVWLITRGIKKVSSGPGGG